jgi:hypothetical protein
MLNKVLPPCVTELWANYFARLKRLKKLFLHVQVFGEEWMGLDDIGDFYTRLREE